MQRKHNNTRKSKPKNNKGGKMRMVGTSNIPPTVLGSQQPKQHIKLPNKIERRLIKGVVSYTSSAGSAITLAICPTVPQYSAIVGTASNTAAADFTSLSGFAVARIAEVELEFIPLQALTVAAPPIYVFYDPLRACNDFTTLTAATAVGYNNTVEFDTRYPATMTWKIQKVSAGEDKIGTGVLRVNQGGWIDATQFSSFTDTASPSRCPGTIGIYGTSLTASTAIFRVMVSFLVECKARV